jgi:acetate---CoA ligase (ADP-forming)
VEVLMDVAFDGTLLSYFQASQLWSSLQRSAILNRVRNHPPADMEALVRETANFSRLISEIWNHFESIDNNLLVVLPEGQGIKALDALFVGNSSSRRENNDAK